MRSVKPESLHVTTGIWVHAPKNGDTTRRVPAARSALGAFDGDRCTAPLIEKLVPIAPELVRVELTR